MQSILFIAMLAIDRNIFLAIIIVIGNVAYNYVNYIVRDYATDRIFDPLSIHPIGNI